jgi:hypothetical protein
MRWMVLHRPVELAALIRTSGELLHSPVLLSLGSGRRDFAAARLDTSSYFFLFVLSPFRGRYLRFIVTPISGPEMMRSRSLARFV